MKDELKKKYLPLPIKPTFLTVIYVGDYDSEGVYKKSNTYIFMFNEKTMLFQPKN